MNLTKWLLVLSVALTGCRSCSTQVKHRPSVVQDVQELKPACANDKCKLGYAYQSDDGAWWYLYWYVLMNNTAGHNYYSNYNSSSYILSNGGGWTRTVTPPTETVGEKEVAMQETENGQPSAVAVEAGATVDVDRPVAEPNETQIQQAEQELHGWENEGGSVAPETESPSMESSPSESGGGNDGGSSGGDSGGGSGGGDSGGGGDGGGGGGGD